MAQLPAEASAPFTSNPDSPLLQERRSVDNPAPSLASSQADTADPDGTSQNQEKNRSCQLYRRIPGPSLWVFLILLAVTGISFCPALLSNKTPSDEVVLEGDLPGVDGVGFSGVKGSRDG